MATNATLTWLHLSDLHACKPRTGWDAARVIETLVEDLEKLRKDHGLRPDLIFFTGDAAFGEIGSEPEKTVAGQLERFNEFLTAVRKVYEPEIPLINTFLVPGNHDVDRRMVSPDQTEWLDRQKSLDPVREMVQTGAIQWKRYMERLAAYRAFLEEQGFDHLLGHAEHLIHANVREVNGWRVGIAGFNTAWSCCRGGERGQLWMAGEWQKGILRPTLQGADFSIALMHHPPDWLGEFETPQFGRRLEHDFRFLLHGHEHRSWVLQNGEEYTVIAGGACYEWSESERNGYNFVRLHPKTGKGEVWLRRFETDGGGRISRIIKGKTDGDGVWNLNLPWLTTVRKEHPTEPESSEDPASEPVTVEEPTSEVEVYLQRLRAAHRNLPLAGFETKVRLPIKVQEVFMPLRVRVRHHAFEKEQEPLSSSRDLCDVDQEIRFDESLKLAAEKELNGVVILGEPGSGKTTLLKHFVLAATDPMIGPAALGLPSDTLPVLIELRSLDRPQTGLKHAIQGAVEKADISLGTEGAARFTQGLLKSDGLLILVDGLDEVADEDHRAAISRWLEEGLDQLPGSTFVVTSRYSGYRNDARLSGRFLELNVKDVEPKQAKAFILDWYRAVESQTAFEKDAEVVEAIAQEQATDLAKKIFAPEDARTIRLRELATNPLMLQIICLVHRDSKRLPERRVELYGECVRVLLEHWRRAKKLPRELDAQQALRLLQPLAYALHKNDRHEAELEELLPILEEPLRELRYATLDGRRLLEAIRDQSGVLVSLGGTKFGFLHLSFQEYLAALHVQDRFVSEPEVLQELASNFGEGRWREVILLALGLNTPSLFDPLLSAILEKGLIQSDATLADDCLRDSLTTSPRPFLRHLAKGQANAEGRYHALRLLSS